jgi:PAS domain-containing protein
MNKGVGGHQEVISNYSKWKCGLMIAFTGADGHIKLVNWEWERTLGWTLEEIQDLGIDIFRRMLPRTAVSPGSNWGGIDVARGEWVDFKPRSRDGRTLDTTWVEVRLSNGTTIGIGAEITQCSES